jgi:NADH-quinone oxidoreductase subunit C
MREEPTITTTPQEWRALAERLKAEGYDQLCDLTSVDWYPEPLRFEVVCQLHDTKQSRFVRIKTRCDAEAPPPTLIPVWPSANWFEREVFDLFGVPFHGHPNLTRMMMPDDFEGHPLRKDYPVEGYR